MQYLTSFDYYNTCDKQHTNNIRIITIIINNLTRHNDLNYL